MTKPLLLLAPGAGAPSSHPWMQTWARRLARIGRVQLFDYDYALPGKKRPDRLPDLLRAHQSALERARHADEPIILAGKSMGGRIGCHLSLQEKIQGLVCFGYPLCGSGDPNRRRDAVLRKLSTPILFIQGTRDPLCPLELLEQVRREMKAPNELYVIEGGNHSLLVPRRELARRGETQNQVDDRIEEVISGFVASLAA